MAKRKRLKSRRVRIAVIVSFIIVIALVAFFVYRAYSGNATAAVTYKTGTVAKMTLTSSVSGTGNVDLATTATVDPGVSGEVSGLTVAVGDKVEAGQTLFTLVNPQLDLAVTTAENSYNEAVLNLSKAQLSVLQAKQSLSNLEDQYEAQSTSTTTAVTTPTTQTPVTLPPTTSTSNAPATTTTTQPGTTTTASATTSSSLASVGVLLSAAAASSATGATQTATTITYLDIKAAKQAITSAQLSVTAAETQVTSAQLAVETAKEDAAKRTVTAPIAGTITALGIANGDTVGSSSSSSSAAQGASSAASSSSSSSTSSTITITNLDAFTVAITLAEADISSIEVGQKAVITFDALPDLTLTGKVTSVDTVGTNSQGVVSYTAIVTPDVTDPTVKGGMTASVNVITKVASDVLAVPSTAIKSDTSGKYVQILKNGTPTNVTVEVGMSSDSYTEVTSGVTEGEEIIVQTVTANASSTATTTRSNSNSILNTGGNTGGPPSGGGFTPPGN